MKIMFWVPQHVFFAYKHHVLASILAKDNFDTDPDSSDMTLSMFFYKNTLVSYATYDF